MINADTELLFPPHVIPELKGLRQATWDKFIARIARAEETAPETLAFVLMMVRLNNCIACNADSFRAMHGCTQCSKQTISRFHGTNKELIELHKQALDEVEKFKPQVDRHL